MTQNSEKRFRITSNLSTAKFSDELTAEVELFREGSWAHPAAPTGWFTVDKPRIETFITNFNRGICGYEIPLEFNHDPNSKDTPGWITAMFEKQNPDGKYSLWAKMKLTDAVTAQRIKDGSLKYISPTVVSDYTDTASGQRFEVIRSATLTNYPHIKRLTPISVNFEEIRKEEEQMTPKEIMEKNDLQLEDIESITLEDLEKGDIDLSYLTEDQIKDLAVKFEMTVEQFQDKYPVAGTNAYGVRPKIKIPPELANLTPEQKKAFLEMFNAMYDKYKDVNKAMAATMKKMQLEESHEDKAASFVDSVLNYVKAKIGKGKETKLEDDEDTEKNVNFQELKGKIKLLEEYKQKKEFEEDKNLLESFSNMTPAVSKILQTLLTVGRNTNLAFEEKKISLHDLVIQLFEELKKAPVTDMFKTISHTQRSAVELAEDLNTRATKWMEDHPGKSYREALDKISNEMKSIS